jgi:hypothetical protein
MRGVRIALFVASAICFGVAVIYLGASDCLPGVCEWDTTPHVVAFAAIGVILAIIGIRLIGWEERNRK